MTDHEHDAEVQDLHDQASRLPKSIEPPRDLWPGIRERIAAGREIRMPHLRRWLPLAAAAALLIVIAGRVLRPAQGWVITPTSGRPLVAAERLAGAGRVRSGHWIVTDDSSSAVVQIGRIGRLEVNPGTRVRVVETRDRDNRLYLARAAAVDASPRLFFVETPSGTAVDLGCAYTLQVDSLGASRLRVTGGYVELVWAGRRSIVPLGASAETRVGMGPGVPVVADAPAGLRAALTAFDFDRGGAAAVREALAAARAEDAVSLWHLLSRVDPPQRAAVYDRLAALVPPPTGVTRAAALRLDSPSLERYWESIRRVAWHREILGGLRGLDSRTGTARR